MTSTDLASLLLKEAKEYNDSSKAYVEEAERALSIDSKRAYSIAVNAAKECDAICGALLEAVKLLLK